MNEPPDDNQQDSPAPDPRGRHGGARPGAGARPGNVNAVKHGRRSPRLRDTLPFAAVTPESVARRVYRQEQRTVERVAASLLRVAVHAAYTRDIADAVAGGRPLPPWPAVSCTNADLDRVRRYLEGAVLRTRLARAQADGAIAPHNAALAQGRRFAESVEQVLPALAALLDRDATATLPSNVLGALLAPPHDQADDQVSAALLESATSALAALAESTPTPEMKRRTIKTPAPPDAPDSPGATPAQSAFPRPTQASRPERESEMRHPRRRDTP